MLAFVVVSVAGGIVYRVEVCLGGGGQRELVAVLEWAGEGKERGGQGDDVCIFSGRDRRRGGSIERGTAAGMLSTGQFRGGRVGNGLCLGLTIERDKGMRELCFWSGTRESAGGATMVASWEADVEAA